MVVTRIGVKRSSKRSRQNKPNYLKIGLYCGQDRHQRLWKIYELTMVCGLSESWSSEAFFSYPSLSLLGNRWWRCRTEGGRRRRHMQGSCRSRACFDISPGILWMKPESFDYCFWGFVAFPNYFIPFKYSRWMI